MTRAEQTIAIFAVVISVYEAFVLKLVPVSQKFQDEIVPVIPFVALVWFGSYLLFKLGWGVFTFNDVPEAHKELMAQIEQARSELRVKGVSVD